MAITAQKNARKETHGGQFIKDRKQLSMKKHPNRKRVLRQIANDMHAAYFGYRLSAMTTTPMELRREIYNIRYYIANGRYF